MFNDVRCFTLWLQEAVQITYYIHICKQIRTFSVFMIRFSNFSGSGSGFSPDGTKKSDLSEDNLKFMTKDRQKMKKATISY